MTHLKALCKWHRGGSWVKFLPLITPTKADEETRSFMWVPLDLQLAVLGWARLPGAAAFWPATPAA